MDLPETATDLFSLAKSKFKEKRYEESTDLFSRALEKKCVTTNSELLNYILTIQSILSWQNTTFGMETPFLPKRNRPTNY